MSARQMLSDKARPWLSSANYRTVLWKQIMVVGVGRLIVAAIAIVISAPVESRAQSKAYPNRPVHLVIPYSPGSPIDTNTRRIADVAQKSLGVPIVVENQPGASGVVGATRVARSVPDGYTLLASPGEPLIASTVLMKSISYDSLQDFRFITKLYASAPVLIANSKWGIKSLAELVERAKSGSINYGSFGPGSFHQIALENLAKHAGIRLEEIAYRAPAQAMQALLSDEVALGFTAPLHAIELAKQGKAAILATIGPQRRAILPGVPTFVEAGFDAPILRNLLWTGVMGPAGIPDDVATRVQNAFADAIRAPEVASFFAAAESSLLGNTPQEFDREFRDEYARVVPAIKAMGIPPQ